jgi:hypothetical protein
MWTAYREIARQYDRLPLRQERRLIARAQRGSTKSAEEIVMRHIGFVMYRLREIVYPSVLWRLGDDILADAVLMLYGKVKTYNLRYRDRRGRRRPVRFVSYVWKRVDGFIIDALNREHRYVAVEDMDAGKWVHLR